MLVFRYLIWPFVAVGLAACQVAGGSEVVPLQVQYVPAVKRVVGRAYVLGPADRIRIKVYNETDITGEYE
jgi:hypothetical protein